MKLCKQIELLIAQSIKYIQDIVWFSIITKANKFLNLKIKLFQFVTQETITMKVYKYYALRQ